MPWLALVLAACSGGKDVTDATGPPERVLDGPLTGQTVAVSGGRVWVSAPGIDGSGGVYGFEGATGNRTLGQASVAVTTSEIGGIGPAFALCDVDGDGQTDLVAGAPKRDRAGGVWLVHAPAGDVSLGTQPFATGTTDGGNSGTIVSCGDVDGDGIAEFGEGAPDTDASNVAIRTGTIAVYRDDGGSPSRIANIDTTYTDSHLGFRSGMVLGADLDGDGTGDVALGAAGADLVHLLFDPPAGTMTTVENGITLSGNDDEGTGYAMASGDIDGDGQADLVVGVPLAFAETGGAWVLNGPFDTASDGLVRDLDRQSRLRGVLPGDQAGFAVDVVGDVDGDGAEDILIGAPFAGGVGPEAGAAYLVLGPADVYGDLDSAEALYLGEVEFSRTGWSVAGGDLDGDGLADIVVGAPEADGGDVLGAGAAYVFSGMARGVNYPVDGLGRIDP